MSGIMFEDTDVEFSLLGKARKSQIAGANEAGNRVVRIGAEAKVELGMEGVMQEQIHDDLAVF